MSIIIFDMDGTLVNSGESITNTINYVRNNLGLESMEKTHILENLNDPFVNTAKYFYDSEDFTLQHKELFEEFYEENCLKDLVLYEGIKELLEDLKSDFTLAVATNANSFYAKRMLAHLEVEKYFKTILGYDSVTKPKPHPEMVEKILDEHSIQKHRAQLIGDSHKDTMAATNAGIDSVLVNWGFSNHKEGAIENVKELEQRIFEKFK